MEHNLFITLNDNTEITYSDIKNKDNNKYITIYFETPTEDGFLSADIDYPNGTIRNNTGYNPEQINTLMYHYNKISKLCFEFALEKTKEKEKYFGEKAKFHKSTKINQIER